MRNMRYFVFKLNFNLTSNLPVKMNKDERGQVPPPLFLLFASTNFGGLRSTSSDQPTSDQHDERQNPPSKLCIHIKYRTSLQNK